MPSFIVIHSTVWPQYTNVTDRQTGQTHRQTDKPVGFYGPIAPPVPNTPSSEFPQFRMPPSSDRWMPPPRRFNDNNAAELRAAAAVPMWESP